MAERRQIAVDCGRSLLTKSVETGRRVGGNRWTSQWKQVDKSVEIGRRI